MPDSHGRMPARRGGADPVLFGGLLNVAALQSSDVMAVYSSGSDIPVTSDGYTASEKKVSFALNHTPATGVELMVVKNTGPGFISGVFSNLAQGQPVALSYGGTVYRFVANYYGGSGNDLVLVWADSSVLSWGSNSQGELGDGSESDRQAPGLVSTAEGVSALFRKTVVAVSAGGGHSLALCSDGTVAAWGDNFSGQLGDNTSETRFTPVAVSAVQGQSALFGKTVVAVSAGGADTVSGGHSLALCSDGTIAAWGENFSGELGDGTSTNRSVPVAVDTGEGSALFRKTVVAISAGYGHSLALCSDGTVAGWGEFSLTEAPDHLRPAAVRNTQGSALFGKTVVAISAGGSHNLALCSDGTIAAWGYNSTGQLGGNAMDDPYIPVAVRNTEGSALSGKTVVAVSAGRDHSLALCSDGTIAAWGGNANGQLGDNTSATRSTPVAVNTAQGVSALFGKTAVAVSGGGYRTLAWCSDGTVTAWGRNNRGQLGDNTLEDRHAPAAVNRAKDVSALFDRTVMRLSAGYLHNLALAAMPSTTRVPSVSFAAAASSAGEAAGTVNVSVALSAPASQEVRVPFTVSGTASGSDAAVSASPLVIPAGASGGSISIAIANDSLYENAETVILTLGTPSGAEPGSVSTHTLTIADDESRPVLAFAAAASSAAENAGTVSVAVTLSGPSSSDITVPFTVSGTASASDATVSASPLVIPAGASGGVITVAVTNDSLHENAETVILTLGTPSGAGLGSVVRHTLTVTDDDATPAATFAAASSSAGENAVL
ncbi:MAG: Calx-beta domain-containing protein [Verrucomicrobiota bacterium]